LKNEQIQNLKDKIWADEYWTKPNTDKLLPAQLNRFAELIVKECAELSVNSQYANTRSEYYEGFNEALVYVGNKIKKHFGVEE